MIVYATDSETGETLPCGLELNDNQWLSDYGYYTGTVCFGIAYATDNKGNAVDFFHYVMNWIPIDKKIVQTQYVFVRTIFYFNYDL